MFGVIGFVLGVVVGFGLCIWFGPNNKNTYAKIRAKMDKAFDDLGAEAQEIKNKVNDALDRK